MRAPTDPTKRNNAVGPQIREGAPRRNLFLPALGLGSILAGFQASTQYFAWKFGYHASLGGNVEHVYAPWAILSWAGKWYSHYPQEITQAGGVGTAITCAGLLAVAAAKAIEANTSKPNPYLHGSARWADKRDIQAAGLLPRDPTIWERLQARLTGRKAPSAPVVYVGGWVDKRGKLHYLRHSGPGHVLTYAPTGSGKGVGLVVPTLTSWAASAVVTDLKRELWELTAGWRKHHANNRVLRFEPASNASGGVAWNPLDEIRLGEHEVGDVQNLATLIVDPDGKGLESHWQKTAYALLVGVILHLLYKTRKEGGVASLPAVDAMLADPERESRELWMEMVTYGHLDGRNHPAVGAAARDMLDRPDEEAGSVLSTAKSYLALYRDPVVAQNVSRSDFRIRQLMHHDDPVTLYIVTEPVDKMRLRPLVRIMVNMIVRLLADGLQFKDGHPVAHYKHKLLLMLDEMVAVGRLQILEESLAFIRIYGMLAYLIVQDLNQIKSRDTGYGPDETLTSNCHVQNAYPPNRVETAEHLSRLTGQTTLVKEQITTSGRRASSMHTQVSRTYQEVQRPLLTPDEAMRMKGPRKNSAEQIVEAGDMVIYVAGYPAIYGRQILYFQDPVFKARAAIPAPSVSDRLIASAPSSSVKVSLRTR